MDEIFDLVFLGSIVGIVVWVILQAALAVGACI